MKRRTLMAAAGLILLAASLTGWFFRADATAPQSTERWEYLVVSGGNTNLSAGGGEYPRMRKQPDGPFSREAFPLERNLDKLGLEGWELVTVAGTPQDPIFYLKRPLKSGR
jgi:hypothetical protein